MNSLHTWLRRGTGRHVAALALLVLVSTTTGAPFHSYAEEMGEATTTADTPVSASSSEHASDEAGATGTSTADTDTASERNATTTGGNGVPTEIATGDARASSTVVTEANVERTGLESVATSSSASTTASSSPASASSTVRATLTTDNELTATTTASTSAVTGGNAAVDADGAMVRTGSARAFATLISIFNIVLTNSVGGLVYLQNPLGPTLDLSARFYEVFGGSADVQSASGSCSFTSCLSEDSALRILTDNVATVYNDLVARASTGGNSAVSDGTAAIASGSARAFGSIVNFGNLSLLDSRYLVLLLNNDGDLNGNVIVPPADFFAQLSSTALVGGDTTVVTDNTANITNYASTTADSGRNGTYATTSASIDTGHARATAFVWNDVNSSSLGARPICFVVSVGGTWNGDVVGLPSGWSREKTPLGEVICGAGSGTTTRGLPVRLHATTTNYADIFNRAVVEATTGANNATGSTASVATGDAESFLQILNIVNHNIVGTDWVFALITAGGDWNGDLMFGSQEFWDAVNAQVRYMTRGGGVLRLGSAKLVIEKTASKSEVRPGESVDYTVRIKNSGGPVYKALLVDTLYTEEGQGVTEHKWSLDTIRTDEVVEVSYTVTFSTSSRPGLYSNKAFVSGVEAHPDYENNLGRPARSPVASATVRVSAHEPLATPVRSCRALLHTYIGTHHVNDPLEVAKLQYFLRTFEGATVPLSGIYGYATEQAVRAFQVKHAETVLQPWGIERPTGYVYFTTQKKINETYCDELDFPLSESQELEMAEFRARIERDRAVTREGLPPTSEDDDAMDTSRVGTAVPEPQSRIAAAPVASVASTGATTRVAAAAYAAPQTVRHALVRALTGIRSAFGWINR